MARFHSHVALSCEKTNSMHHQLGVNYACTDQRHDQCDVSACHPISVSDEASVHCRFTRLGDSLRTMAASSFFVANCDSCFAQHYDLPRHISFTYTKYIYIYIPSTCAGVGKLVPNFDKSPTDLGNFIIIGCYLHQPSATSPLFCDNLLFEHFDKHFNLDS